MRTAQALAMLARAHSAAGNTVGEERTAVPLCASRRQLCAHTHHGAVGAALCGTPRSHTIHGRANYNCLWLPKLQYRTAPLSGLELLRADLLEMGREISLDPKCEERDARGADRADGRHRPTSIRSSRQESRPKPASGESSSHLDAEHPNLDNCVLHSIIKRRWNGVMCPHTCRELPRRRMSPK